MRATLFDAPWLFAFVIIFIADCRYAMMLSLLHAR